MESEGEQLDTGFFFFFLNWQSTPEVVDVTLAECAHTEDSTPSILRPAGVPVDGTLQRLSRLEGWA